MNDFSKSLSPECTPGFCRLVLTPANETASRFPATLQVLDADRRAAAMLAHPASPSMALTGRISK